MRQKNTLLNMHGMCTSLCLDFLCMIHKSISPASKKHALYMKHPWTQSIDSVPQRLNPAISSRRAPRPTCVVRRTRRPNIFRAHKSTFQSSWWVWSSSATVAQVQRVVSRGILGIEGEQGFHARIASQGSARGKATMWTVKMSPGMICGKLVEGSV